MFKIFVLLVPTLTSICTFSGCYLVLHKFQRVSTYLQNYIIHSLSNYCCFPVIAFGHIPLKNKILCKKSIISIKVELLEFPKVQWLCFLVPLQVWPCTKRGVAPCPRPSAELDTSIICAKNFGLCLDVCCLKNCYFDLCGVMQFFQYFKIFFEDLLKFKN